MCYKSVCPQGHHDCLSKLSPVRVAAEAAALLRETWRTRNGGGALPESPARPHGGEQVLQPLFAQRPPGARKSNQLEPLTPIVIHRPAATPGVLPVWGKGRFTR
jgi:hypothetical protein